MRQQSLNNSETVPNKFQMRGEVKLTDYMVYLIEDDEGSRASTQCLLGVHGIPLRSFSSAEQFFFEVVGNSFGCIVTDLVLPGMSGLEMFLRTRELGWTTPVIMLTAFGDVPTAVLDRACSW